MPATRKTIFTCEICGATCNINGDDTLWHRRPCPAANALDDLAAEDAQFFLDRPHAPHRRRALELCEWDELLTAGADITGTWRCIVQPHPAGLKRTLTRDGKPILIVLTAPRTTA